MVKDLPKRLVNITEITSDQANLREKLDEVLRKFDEMTSQKAKEAVSAKKVEELVTRDEIDNLKAQFISLSEAFEVVENKVSSYDDDFNDLAYRVVGLEAQGRRDSIVVHGLSDIPKDRSEKNIIGYVCHKLNTLLPRGFRINPGHIHTAHLIAPRNRNNKTPIMLIKFAYRWLRNDFYYDRHNI